jgi:hypothetical protein
MDEIAAAEIRKWAWEQMDSKSWGTTSGEPISFRTTMKHADDIAAWVMSGKISGDQP